MPCAMTPSTTRAVTAARTRLTGRRIEAVVGDERNTTDAKPRRGCRIRRMPMARPSSVPASRYPDGHHPDMVRASAHRRRLASHQVVECGYDHGCAEQNQTSSESNLPVASVFDDVTSLAGVMLEREPSMNADKAAVTAGLDRRRQGTRARGSTPNVRNAGGSQFHRCVAHTMRRPRA